MQAAARQGVDSPAPAAPVPSGKSMGRAPLTNAPSGDPGSPGYRSPLEGYRPYAHQPIEPWRAANDRVRDIGGWKAYAREAQEPQSAPGRGGAAPADQGHGAHGTHAAPSDPPAAASRPAARPDAPSGPGTPTSGPSGHKHH